MFTPQQREERVSRHILLSHQAFLRIMFHFPPKMQCHQSRRWRKKIEAERPSGSWVSRHAGPPNESYARLHLLSFDCHFTVSSSLFPPSSLTHSAIWKETQPGNIPFLLGFFSMFPYVSIQSYCSLLYLLHPFRGFWNSLERCYWLACAMIFVSRLLKGNKHHL